MRRRSYILSLCVAVSLALTVKSAEATPYWRTVAKNAVVVADTATGHDTPSGEAERIGANWDDYNDQKALGQLFSVPQLQLDGSYPIFAYLPEDVGSSVNAQFIFIDPRVGTPTSPGFDVAAVQYAALLDPAAINPSQLLMMSDTAIEDAIRANLTPLGIATNSANNFSLSFTLQGFEPIVFGFPLDAQFHEITGEGKAAYVSTVITPEPSPLFLLGTGLVVLGVAVGLKTLSSLS